MTDPRSSSLRDATAWHPDWPGLCWVELLPTTPASSITAASPPPLPSAPAPIGHRPARGHPAQQPRGHLPTQFFVSTKPLSYPRKHSHSKLPGVLTQVPRPQRSGEMWHSSMSAEKGAGDRLHICRHRRGLRGSLSCRTEPRGCVHRPTAGSFLPGGPLCQPLFHSQGP